MMSVDQMKSITAAISLVFAVAAGPAFAQNITPPVSRGNGMATISPDIVKSLAPTGTLRAGINLGNIVLAQTAANGELAGVSVELARELGRRLDVPVELSRFDAAGKSFEAPYVLIEGVYMVPKDSPIQSVAEVDREGVRIAVNKASAYDLFLTRSLKRAKLVRGESGVGLFVSEKLEAAAGVKQPIVAYAKAHPEVRVLDGRFMDIQQAMGTAKGRDAGARYLHAFVEEMKASGFVADALKRSNQPDASVAPPAGT
jgi:polar amino acid transport system substrate-binding protein